MGNVCKVLVQISPQHADLRLLAIPTLYSQISENNPIKKKF